MKTIAAMLLLPLTLAAGTAFAGGEMEPAAEGSVELELWLDSNNGEASLARWQSAVLTPFTEANPNIRFETALIASLYDATRAALATGCVSNARMSSAADAVSDHMIAEATLTAHFIDAALQAGMTAT